MHRLRSLFACVLVLTAAMSCRAEDKAGIPKEALEELSYLVGQWDMAIESESGDTQIGKWNVRWSKGNRYCLTTAGSTNDDSIQFTSIMGWDAATRRIRHWIMTSDGGNIAARYTPESATLWEGKEAGVLPDGTDTKAASQLKKLGPDEFTLTLTNRVEGIMAVDDVEVHFRRSMRK